MGDTEVKWTGLGKTGARLLAGASILALGMTVATPAFAQESASSAAAPAVAEDQDTTGGQAVAENDEIVVTGIRVSLRNARDRKRNAEQIVDSITAQDIGALPDRSVSEALQRIPGVTLQRTNEARDPARLSAEGGGVFIRGLSWVRSEINGRDIFSARNGRALNFEDISSDLLAGIDVYKNPSAELVEGGIGGIVDLRTRKPFDQAGQLIAASADYNYADLLKDGFFSGSVLYSNRWNTSIGEIGLLASFSHGNIGNRTDSIQLGAFADRGGGLFTPSSFGIRRIDWEQKRTTYSGSVQWAPSSDLLFTFEGIYAKATPKDTEFLVGDYQAVVPALPTLEYDEDGVMESGEVAGRLLDLDTRRSGRKYITQDYSANVRWTPADNWTVTADIQHVKSSADIDDFTVYTETSLPGTAIFDLSGNSPSLTYDFPTGDPEDPASYYWTAAMDHFERNDAKEWAYRADVEHEFDDNSFLRSFRFGTRYTDKDAITRQTGYNWGLLSQAHWMSWCGCAIPITGSQFNGASELQSFGNFFNGKSPDVPGTWFPSADMVGLGPQGAYDQYLQFARSQGWSWVPLPDQAYLNLNPAGDNISGGVNEQSEKTLAGYGLLRFGMDDGALGKFDGNIGLRVVRTRNDANGSGVQVATISGTTTVAGCLAAAALAGHPASACDPLADALAFVSASVADNPIDPKNSYTDWLPSLNLRFFLQDNLYLRLAASKAIYRPEFRHLNTFASLSFNFDGNGLPINYGTPTEQPTAIGTGASPDLESQKANQLDASVEYYFGNAGQLSAAIFYKKIKGYIVAFPVEETFANANGDSLTFVLNRYVNSDKGSVKGVELAYQQFYDMLPKPFDGLGLQANFTYIDSSGGANTPGNIFNSPEVGNAFADLPMEGMSKYAYNIALMYEKYGISARLAWNWRSHYLLTTSAANINQPVWAEDYGQLDGSIFYDITKNFKVGVQGTNLTRSKTFLDVGYTDFHPRYSWTVGDRRFAFIVRARF